MTGVVFPGNVSGAESGSRLEQHNCFRPGAGLPHSKKEAFSQDLGREPLRRVNGGLTRTGGGLGFGLHVEKNARLHPAAGGAAE
jgi:hypothetical protein